MDACVMWMEVMVMDLKSADVREDAHLLFSYNMYIRDVIGVRYGTYLQLELVPCSLCL